MNSVVLIKKFMFKSPEGVTATPTERSNGNLEVVDNEGTLPLKHVMWIEKVHNVLCYRSQLILYLVLGVFIHVVMFVSFLQKWIFEGICHDTYSEFFIQERMDLMTNRQREYWSQGHSLFMDAVPGFLHGLEEPIFQCGKALNLLKLCNPQVSKI